MNADEHRFRNRLLACFICVYLCSSAAILAQDADPAKDTLIVETLIRLERYDLNGVKPETKAAVLRHVETHRGAARFVELAELFNIREKSDELLRVALDKPQDPLGISAARLLLKFDEMERVKTALGAGDDKAAVAAVDVFSATQEKKALGLIAPIITDAKRSSTVRNAAVRGLGRNPAGEKSLLELAAAGKLPEDVKFTAANILLSSRDEKTRAEAGKYLKLPAANNKPLPPIAELIKRKGDTGKGKEVYAKATCIACHKVGDAGIDFGPALGEIGDKLPREALYAAILDPSAGISFGFEGFLVSKTDGTQLLGYIAGETADEVTLKLIGGVSFPIKKSEIKSREKQPQSLMPANLVQLISEEELVDLVEYMSALKKAK